MIGGSSSFTPSIPIRDLNLRKRITKTNGKIRVIEIVLDKEKAVFEPGESITGRIELELTDTFRF